MTETHAPELSTRLARRTVLRGAVLAGAAVPLLAACGSSDASSASSSGGGGGAEPIAKTSDVPEGGGLILKDPAYVITQPTAGDFKAFTNVCTHMGCTVSNVTNGTINCLCHGSQYSIADGSVVTGPATLPLAAENITVKGTEILEA